MLLQKLQKKKNHPSAAKGNRFLINICVLGSAGPICFVVNEEELVAAVIHTALKSYAREGRLPVLGYHDIGDFMLYCLCDNVEALSPWDTIGSLDFEISSFARSHNRRRPQPQKPSEDNGKQKQTCTHMARKTWFNKSVPPKVSCR